VFIYSELKKKAEAYEAMSFHEDKIIISTAIKLLIIQVLFWGLLAIIL
jgi:hypothetical protein